MIEEIKGFVWRELIAARIPRHGFRPAAGTPTDDEHLAARFGYDEEDAIKAAVRRVRASTMTSFERLATLWQQVRHLDRRPVEGSLVECGVWRGGSAGMMALAHLATHPAPTRELHLFDSFEGLPEPRAAVDGAEAVAYAHRRASGALGAIGECVGPLEDNRALLEGALGYPAALLHYHRGWFQDTLPADAPALGPIALLRLDGDWYESTKVCLDHLYGKVASGGVVVADDYGHWEGCRRAVDEFLAAQGPPVLLHHIDYTGRYWLKP